jgi:putative redox protein
MTADAGSSPLIVHVPIQVDWAGGLQFDAGRLDGPKVRLDGDTRTGPNPVDTLLAALAACAATDVVLIMEKQRTPLKSLSVRVDAQRVASIPKRLAAAVLHFTLQGAGITPEKAERAVELAVTKYCSVGASLRPDAPVTWTIELKT